MVPAESDHLISLAKEALKNAIAPNSGFRVGAALETDDGRIFTGCNVENPSLMLSMCAERVALYKALSEGATSFRAMAIVSDPDRYCYPCGACRQLLMEFAPGILIYLSSTEGVKQCSIEELLPHPFNR
jgi:homotetrameric cytidine deaminase